MRPRALDHALLNQPSIARTALLIAVALVMTMSLGACDGDAQQDAGNAAGQGAGGNEAQGLESSGAGSDAEGQLAGSQDGPPAEAPEAAGEQPPANIAGEQPPADVGDAPEAAAGPPTSEAAALATARVAEMLPQQVTAFGVSGSSPGQMMLPFDVAVGPEGDIYLSDSTGVQRFSESGEFIGRVGEGEVLTALGGLAVAPDGTVYVTGFESQVLVFGPDGESRPPIGTQGTGPGELSKPVDVAVDSAGAIYVADAENGRVEKFDATGSHVLSIGAAESGRGGLRRPSAVAVDDDGIVYVGEGDDFLVQRYGADGEYLDAFGQGHADENIWRIGGLSVSDDGTVYATQAMSNRLQAFDPAADLTLAWEFGSLGRGSGEFSTPMGLDLVDCRLFVADQQNNRVVIYALSNCP